MLLSFQSEDETENVFCKMDKLGYFHGFDVMAADEHCGGYKVDLFEREDRWLNRLLLARAIVAGSFSFWLIEPQHGFHVRFLVFKRT
jgi:hypothetical protein